MYTQTSTPDWRRVIQRNRRRTYCVILSFIGIFLCVGFCLDMVYIYNTAMLYNYRSMSLLGIAFDLLYYGYRFPYITVFSVIGASIWVIVTFLFHNKLMLTGTQYQEIRSEEQNPNLTRIYNVVEEMKIAANLHYMPKVYLMHAPYMNAFSSGISEKSAMIVVTTGLVEALNRSELQAVVAHELTHIRNQDIRLNLFVTSLSNFLMLMLEWLFWSALFSRNSNTSDSRNNGGSAGGVFLLVVILLRWILPVITMLLMLFLSRSREYMADAGAVELMRDNVPMGNALLKIQANHENPEHTQAYVKGQASEKLRRAAYIYDPESSDFFSTHPSLKKRLEAIGLKITGK